MAENYEQTDTHTRGTITVMIIMKSTKVQPLGKEIFKSEASVGFSFYQANWQKLRLLEVSTRGMVTTDALNGGTKKGETQSIHRSQFIVL